MINLKIKKNKGILLSSIIIFVFTLSYISPFVKVNNIQEPLHIQKNLISAVPSPVSKPLFKAAVAFSISSG